MLYAKSPGNDLALSKSGGPIEPRSRNQLSRSQKNSARPFVLQGNIDPAIMESTPERVKSEAIRVLDSMRDDPAHILNLGHGIRPNAKIECMEALVETNQSYH